MARKSSTRQTRQPRLTRSEKLQQERLAVDNTQVVQMPSQMPRFDPANQNQKRAKALVDTGTQVVLLQGSAGTGKSLIAAWRAATLLKTKQIDKVFLVRPAVGVGKSIGLLPGTELEKLMPFFAQTIAHIEKFLGVGFTKYCLEKDIISLKAVEYLRGYSFSNCLVICEESQGFTHSEFEMLLTRLEESAQLICTGDTKQNDLKVLSGLKTTTDLINRMVDDKPDYLNDEDLDALASSFGIVNFTPDDVIRGGLTKALVKTYFYNT